MCQQVAAMEVARAIGSLPVANVQALAETCNAADDQVPERYLVKESSSEEVISGDDSISAIPSIDFGKLCDPRSSPEECAKLGSACKTWGFFQVRNSSTMEVPNEVTGNLTKDVAEFFKQPLEAKKAYSQLPSSLEGYGQGFVVSEDQKLEWADMMYLQAFTRCVLYRDCKSIMSPTGIHVQKAWAPSQRCYLSCFKDSLWA
ncbi:hypothetical protein PR202_ga25700 [Eleusine coracana subsp. coracana]|uniref:Non-haem dioxygenase N-terminal domain-containing protein n=1 Tax=Eleusine coracana subsp. coracana TaxID=191504 RepID=A0AAV5DC13_ELECO|nr:hypothetical protein PR202_ga25700 [Eleusine coracana subsp. coracana]